MNIMIYRDFLKKKNSRGFSLIELLVAMTILAFTISALLLSFVSCLLLNESNNNLVIAVNDAQYVLEQIKDEPYPNIPFFVPTQMVNLHNENILLNPAPFHPGGDTKIYEITVNVTWTERGRNRSFSLTTRIANAN